MRKFRHQLILDILDFECPPERISEIIGQQPTDSYQKGAKRGATGVYPRSMWYYYSKAEKYESLFDVHVDDFLSKFDKGELIGKIKEIATVKVTLLCRFDRDCEPKVYFDKPLIEFIYKNELSLIVEFG